MSFFFTISHSFKTQNYTHNASIKYVYNALQTIKNKSKCFKRSRVQLNISQID